MSLLEKYEFHMIGTGMHCYSRDINFCYPDRIRMSQTKFVPVAKKVLSCGPDFSAEFSAPPEFSSGV